MKGNLLAQYLRIKAQHTDAILLFRLGDFYEMFFDDAREAAGLLDLTLTARNRGDPDEVPLCGFPAHAAAPYVARLLAAGRRVAICEQVASRGRGLLDREVVRVVTPGTVLEEESLDPGRPSLLAAVAHTGEAIGLATVDFATGLLRVTESGDGLDVCEELARLAPRELLLDPALPPDVTARCQALGAAVAPLPGDTPEAPESAALGGAAARAAAGLRAYLAATFRGSLAHLGPPERYALSGFLAIDATTRRNLELVETLRGERRGSLLGVLDRAVTPMGSRLLREWILYPRVDPAVVGERLDAVEWLVEHPETRAVLRDALAGTGDLARLAGRVGAGTAGPRDVAMVAAALRRAAAVQDAVTRPAVPALVETLGARLAPLPDVVTTIEQTLVDNPPPHTRAPGFVRAGAHPEVDALRAVATDGKGWIARFEAEERQRTGIGSLKVRHNKVFGYYLEVTKANLGAVPADYERKQTLVNAERFVTPALKEYEARVLGAEERLRTLEQHVFDGLLGQIQRVQPALARTAAALAALDGLGALAEVAHRHDWTRPRITRARTTRIRAGRHPVVEALGPDPFVPNDVEVAADGPQIAIVTGPNMGGKSTYLRQVALLTILAHMGSFVPAAEAEIGVTDRVFTRVGASDDLVRGESTFMVEMRETAHILAHLTDRSLVILDEIGRGTSTFDGISIAWAVAEYLHEAPERPRTLFATHYHELTALPAHHERVVNLSVGVAEWKGDIVFLRRIVPGPAPRSYGVDVAKLAGVPAPVVERARALLAELERGAGPAHGSPTPAGGGQLSLFGAEADGLISRLAALDVERLTPLDALGRLAELVEEARRLR